MTPFSHAIVFPILLPTSTQAPVHGRPWVTYGLMAAIGVGFVFDFLAPGTSGRLLLHFDDGWLHYLTYPFLHRSTPGGAALMALDLYMLWLFGPPLETRMKGPPFLALFLASGASAGAAWHFLSAAGDPLDGAMGAVMGLMGAFIILFPYTWVNCILVWLILVVPVKLGRTRVITVFLVMIYVGLEWLIPWVALNFSLRWVDVRVFSTAAGLGGLSGGLALASMVYGFHAFTAEADDEAADERRVVHELERDLRATESRRKHGIRVATHDEIRQEARMAGLSPEERERFTRLVRQTAGACPGAASAIALARVLDECGEYDMAIETLDGILARTKIDALLPEAQWELARRLVESRRDLPRARLLLDRFLAANPPFAHAEKARDVLAELDGMLDDATAALTTGQRQARAAWPPPQYPDVKVPLGAPPEAQDRARTDGADPGESTTSARYRRIAQILGSPYDSAAAMPPRIDEPPSYPRQAAPSIEDGGLGIADSISAGDPQPSLLDRQSSGDAAIELPELSKPGEDRDAFAPSPLVEPLQPGIHPMSLSHPIEVDENSAPPNERRTLDEGPGTRFADRRSPLVNPRDAAQSEHAAHVRLLCPDVRWPDGERGSFAVVLQDPARAHLPALVDLFAPLLKLTGEATHFALARRHGVLADGLPYGVAESLAREVNGRGMKALTAAQVATLEFGRPRDATMLHAAGRRARWTLEDGLHELEWKQVVLLGAALVTEAASSRPRAVMDLLYLDPTLHLRIWEPTFSYPPRLSPDPQRRFLQLARALKHRGRGALATGSFERWLTSQSPLPNDHFISTVEWESYLAWHVLARLSPVRMVR